VVAFLDETVLNLRNPLSAAPEIAGHRVVLSDDHTLEVEVSKEQNLNDIFARLSELRIEVLSMRSKTNRLEELFIGHGGLTTSDRRHALTRAMLPSSRAAIHRRRHEWPPRRAERC